MFANFAVVDSLVANEFSLELEGAPVTGIFKVSNFVSFALDANGKRVKSTFELSKMVQRDPKLPFNQWLRDTFAKRNSDDRPKRDLVLLAVDDGTITRRWFIRGAYIARVSYSEFDVAQSDMVAETYTIAYDDIEDTFAS